MRRIFVGFVFAGLLAPAALVASVPVGGQQPWDTEEGPRPTAVTSSVECVVVEVREDRTLVVRDGHEREHVVQIPEKAKIRAKNRREFDGKKKLEFGQLRPGHELKLTFLRENGEIVRVKVLGTASA